MLGAAKRFCIHEPSPEFLTQDSTQGAGGCERRANVITGGLRQPPRGLEAAWRQVHRHAPHRRGSEGTDRADSAEHREAFRADETGRQQVTSAGHQTYRHARASTITTRTIIKFISAHKSSVRLSPLLSLCIVMTSLQDASLSTIYYSSPA